MRLKRLTMVRLAYFACAKVSAGVWAARILHCVCWHLRRVLVSDCAFAGCAYVFVPTPLVAWQLLLSTGRLPARRRDAQRFILTSLLVVCRLTFRRVDNDEATRSALIDALIDAAFSVVCLPTSFLPSSRSGQHCTRPAGT